MRYEKLNWSPKTASVCLESSKFVEIKEGWALREGGALEALKCAVYDGLVELKEHSFGDTDLLLQTAEWEAFSVTVDICHEIVTNARCLLFDTGFDKSVAWEFIG